MRSNQRGLPMSLYPEVLRQLGNSCSQYRQRLIESEELQAGVRNAEELVTAYEERELRKFLHWAEGELELIRFTMNEDRAFQESLNVVSKIEETIERWEHNSPTAR
jgi:hypothetical protein